MQYLLIFLTWMATNKQYWLFLDLYKAIQSICIGFMELFFDIFDLFDYYYYINFLLQKFQTYLIFVITNKVFPTFQLENTLSIKHLSFLPKSIDTLSLFSTFMYNFPIQNFSKFFLTKLQKHENTIFYIFLHNFCISWGTWTSCTKKWWYEPN